MKFLVLIHISLLASILLPGQQKEFVYKNFTQEEGLPSNEVYQVFEDSRHYIWMATDLGVVRYNGNRFQQFSLPDNVVFKIREDSKGRIWFFSHKALLAYFENEKMHLYKYNQKIARRIQKINIVDAYVDSMDNIYLNSSLDSNFILHSNGLIEAKVSSEQQNRQTIVKITETENRKFLSTIEKTSGQNTNSLKPTYFSVDRKNGQQNVLIPLNSRPFSQFGAVADEEGNIYFFGNNQLLKLRVNGSWQTTILPEKILSLKILKENIVVGLYRNGAIPLSCTSLEKSGDTILPGKSITSICQGYEGELWFSTLENGVYLVKNSSIIHIRQAYHSNQLVSGLMNLEDSTLVYAKPDGFYTYTANKNNLFFPLENLSPTSLFTDSSKTLYFVGGGMDIATIHPYKDNNFSNVFTISSPSEPVRLNRDSFVIVRSDCIVRFKSDYTAGGFKLSGYDSGYSNSFKWLLLKPGKIYIDSKRILWCGTNDGLYRSDRKIDTLLKIIDTSVLLAKGVNCIRELDNGIIAVGIRNNGIALIVDSTIIATISENEGLASNKIKYLMPFKNTLWAATAKGISVIKFSSMQPLKYTIENIGKSDGLYNIIIYQLMPFQDKIVAATSNGLYFIENPGTFLERRNIQLPFYINAVTYYRGDTTGVAAIVLPYSKNRLVIKYSAVSSTSYDNVQYLFRTGNNDTAWHSTTSTELLFENLEPGTYTIEVKAVMPNVGRMSEIQRLTVIVEIPWWRNNWFRLFAFMLAGISLYLIIRQRIRKIRTEEKRKTDLNAKLTELEQTALRSQMNPHFIFNCLTSIQQLIISGNKTDANEYLVKFSRLIRKTLEMSAQPFITIREEKEYLEEYLLLEQLRLEGQFDFTIKADDNIDMARTLIPNMMLQPIVENCVRHGVKSLKNRKGIISVHFTKGNNSITCSISDNGVGRESTSLSDEKNFTKHKSYGMENVRKRLETFSEYNADESGIEIKDLFDNYGNPSGTEVILHLPYKNNL